MCVPKRQNDIKEELLSSSSNCYQRMLSYWLKCRKNTERKNSKVVKAKKTKEL